ncbi:MAG: hypothetical protein MSA68_07655 [Helicobacter sp.]|nr:hypothetical protein [Helicobacter sp.]
MLNSKNSKKSLEFLVPHIDYIMFLDPDDYWREDCVQECLKAFADSKAQGKQAEIVWFDNDVFYENMTYDKISFTRFEYFSQSIPRPIIDSQEWFEFVKDKEIGWTFAWSGMIDFSFLQKIGLYFINGLNYAEDLGFGIVLFMRASYIARVQKKLYAYRVRDNSNSNFEKSAYISVAPVLYDLLKVFGDPYLTRKYHHQECAIAITFSLIDELEKSEDEKTKKMARHFLRACCLWSLSIFYFDKDPHNIKQKLPKLKPYVKDLHLGRLNCLKHLVISYPKLGFVYAWTQKLKYRGGKKWLEKL